MTTLHRLSRSPWIIYLCITLFISGCSTVTGHKVKLKEIDGPLVGQIYDNKQQQYSQAEFLTTIEDADVIYLGEQHQNNQHHEFQLIVLQHLIAQGKTPSIALEAVPFTLTSALLSYANLGASLGHSASPEHQDIADAILKQKLQWQEEDSDGQWRHYGKIIQLARQHQLTIVGMDLPKSLRHRITNLGTDKLTMVEKSLLAPSDFSDDLYQQMMFQQFKQAHCGYGHEEYLSRLYDNWIARNDRMASTIMQLSQQNNDRPIVVIVGHGHTQFGMGIYERVNALSPTLSQVNLTFRAIKNSNDQASNHIGEFQFAEHNFGFGYDYYWFSKGYQSGVDQCAIFKQRKKK